MIKTVKVKKKLRLDELIKYVRENGVNSQAFVSDCGRTSVYFDSEQNFSFGEYTFGELDIERTFTVEMEEKITWDTVFECLIEILPNDDADIWYGSSVNDFETTDTQKVYALIEGKLELIWEAE